MENQVMENKDIFPLPVGVGGGGTRRGEGAVHSPAASGVEQSCHIGTNNLPYLN